MDLSSFVIEFYIYSQIVLTNPFANVPPLPPPPPKKVQGSSNLRKLTIQICEFVNLQKFFLLKEPRFL